MGGRHVWWAGESLPGAWPWGFPSGGVAGGGVPFQGRVPGIPSWGAPAFRKARWGGVPFQGRGPGPPYGRRRGPGRDPYPPKASRGSSSALRQPTARPLAPPGAAPDWPTPSHLPAPHECERRAAAPSPAAKALHPAQRSPREQRPRRSRLAPRRMTSPETWPITAGRPRHVPQQTRRFTWRAGAEAMFVRGISRGAVGSPRLSGAGGHVCEGLRCRPRPCAWRRAGSACGPVFPRPSGRRFPRALALPSAQRERCWSPWRRARQAILRRGREAADARGGLRGPGSWAGASAPGGRGSRTRMKSARFSVLWGRGHPPPRTAHLPIRDAGTTRASQKKVLFPFVIYFF